MGLSRFKSIVENLDGALSMRRGGPEKPAAPVEEGTPPKDDAKNLDGARAELRAQNEAIDKLGQKLALQAFGSALDQIPSRTLAHAGGQPFQATDNLKPFFENYTRLTKPLFESQAVTVYREDLEAASLLYVACGLSGRTFEQAVRFAEHEKRALVEQEFLPIVRDPRQLDELLAAVMPALASAGKAIAAGAGVAAGQRLANKIMPPSEKKDEVAEPSVAAKAKALIEEKWIGKAIKHPGALHRDLHVPAGKNIPEKKLEKAAHAGGKEGRRAELAMTLKKMHK